VTSSYRAIPSVDQLSQQPAFRTLEAAYGRVAVVDAIRAEAAVVRGQMAEGDMAGGDIPALIAQRVRTRLATALGPSLVGVINATGVVIHTNLGRAPLARAAVERVAALTTGYSNLEYDLAAGRRGHRDIHAERLLCKLTGAEAAVIANNNAAATLLTLAALAAGREVIISRGELVEIGGGFRVPDVMAQSGAVLREVGTTNRTRVADYAAAITDRTALILRVHPSNFRIEGFTERPDLAELAAMGRRFGVPLVEDLGSGFLGVPAGVTALRDEPIASASLAAGAALVLFSGDKLLGGPQAGVIAGNADAVTRIRRHPLMRALRAGKLTYAALEATLEEIATGRAATTVPVTRMIATTVDQIAGRAAAVAQRLDAAGVRAEVVDGASAIGGGSAPGTTLPTRLIAIGLPADRLESALRRLEPPVIARIDNGHVVLDLRTVDPADDNRLADLVGRAAATLFP
jgi:L-seryl-tRNA(Ser) seleniumtransferase